jgi:hypothetical protein
MTDRICICDIHMQTKKEDGLKPNEPSIDEQLASFAELLIDIYFELENKIIEDEEE